jgi:hypothetical protein
LLLLRNGKVNPQQQRNAKVLSLIEDEILDPAASKNCWHSSWSVARWTSASNSLPNGVGSNERSTSRADVGREQRHEQHGQPG